MNKFFGFMFVVLVVCNLATGMFGFVDYFLNTRHPCNDWPSTRIGYVISAGYPVGCKVGQGLEWLFTTPDEHK